MNIIGINAFHADSSAVLLKNDKLIFAVEEERLRRVKHWAGFPSLSIKLCLKEAGIDINDIDHIAINTNPFSNLRKKILYSSINKISLKFLYSIYKNKKERFDIKKNFLSEFGNLQKNIKFHFLEHHLCHMASAYYASNFKEAVVVSIDGFGDFSSAAYGYGKDLELKRTKRIIFPDSLGIFYTAMTQYLGFPNYGDEYKVMGLAPYGKDTMLSELKKVVSWNNQGEYKLNLKYFLHTNKEFKITWDNGEPIVSKNFSDEMVKLLGPAREPIEKLTQRDFDIAKCTQIIYEEALFNLLNKIYENSSSNNLCIAGGCGANSVANGKIIARTNFDSLYVQAAAGDAGGALGAAYLVSKKILNKRPKSMLSPYLGPCYKDKDISAELNSISKKILEKERIKIYKIGDNKVKDYNKFLDIVVDALISGLVVGWFQGKMEWGPRALGNRSILGDPRRKDMKDILNLKIKKRESFRPFAPSILKKNVHEWFEIPKQDFEVPYMMKVYKFREEKRNLVPAVCHVDHTGRLQTVTKSMNERYFDLISLFFKKTNVPMILNTSFNENEPIVCSPNESIKCFLRTNMDLLAIGDYLLVRNIIL